MKISHLENFEELSNFDEICISNNLDEINNFEYKKKILVLLYPEILTTKKNIENITIKNLPLYLFNKDYTFRWIDFTCISFKSPIYSLCSFVHVSIL